ncbi:MAG TPA: hypothetical protein VGB04_13440 [Allosphingosinicella sp.]|jgi:hypothetical protein
MLKNHPLRNPRLRRRAALALALALPAGCISTAEVPETIYSACHVLKTSDWKAQVELFPNSSPIPYVRRKLVVTGKVTTAAGYSASIDEGPVSRLDEPVQQVLVRTEGRPEAGAAPVTHNVRGVFTAMKSYGGVSIRCGDGIIAEIAEVPVPPRQEGEDPFRL